MVGRKYERILTASMRAVRSSALRLSKRSISRSSWAKALTTFTPGMVSASIEFNADMRRQMVWKTQWMRRLYISVPITMSGVGISARTASCQFIRNRATPIPTSVMMAMTMS